MGTEENKKTNSGQYKPVLSQSTVQKRTSSQSKNTEGSVNGRTSSNRQSGSNSRTATNRQNGTNSRTATNRQNGTNSRTATNRQSGSNSRTATNRQNGTNSRTATNHQGGSAANRQNRNNSNRTQNARRTSSSINNRRKKSRSRGIRITANQFILILAVIIGLIMVCIINGIMRHKYLKVNLLEGDYAMGTTFDISSFVEPVNDNAKVSFSGTFEPEKIGTYKIKYTVRCGKLKKKNKLTIEVVDRDFPDIQGPDEISFVVGEDANLGAYYTVVDSQPDLTKSLMADKTVDTSAVSTKDITLMVTDWCNNSSTKDIVVNVYDYEGDDAYIAKSIREYNRVTGDSVDANGLCIYREDKSQTACYILINDETIVNVDNDGICTVETSDETSQDMVDTIKENGKYVGISQFDTFNYNK